MPDIPSPLPPSEFEDYRKIILSAAPAGLPCGRKQVLTIQQAAGIAFSIEFALGRPGRIAEDETAVVELSALQSCLSRFGTAEGDADSDRAMEIALGKVAPKFGFSFDMIGLGPDEGAHVPVSIDDVRRLNRWMRESLAVYQRALYAAYAAYTPKPSALLALPAPAAETAPSALTPAAPPPSEPEPEPEPEPPRAAEKAPSRPRPSPKQAPVIAAIETALSSGRTTKTALHGMTWKEVSRQFGRNKVSRTTCERARKAVLDKPD